MKKNWIYQLRGLAIIAVVLGHQQGITHNTEVLQLLSLYSVTTLIFLMGVTKTYSLCSKAVGKKINLLAYTMSSMKSVLLSYVVASGFYVLSSSEGGMNYSILLSQLLTFSASQPFYFIGHYILLSLWAPVLFAVIRKSLLYDGNIVKKVISVILVFTGIWMIGYHSIGRCDIFGQSYLFVYSLGLGVGIVNLPKMRKMRYVFVALLTFLLGLMSTYKFYSARLEGNYNYAEGIDMLAPKLQMNPPNISIIIYSLGVIFLGYIIFESINNKGYKCFKIIGNIFIVLGKYSMDIFLWHLYIQGFLNGYFLTMRMGMIKCIIYYVAMLGIPIMLRIIYNKLKEYVYDSFDMQSNII